MSLEHFRKMVEVLKSNGVAPTSEGYVLYCDPAVELDMTPEQMAEPGVVRHGNAG
jgi:hypothetical protein